MDSPQRKVVSSFPMVLTIIIAGSPNMDINLKNGEFKRQTAASEFYQTVLVDDGGDTVPTMYNHRRTKMVC